MILQIKALENFTKEVKKLAKKYKKIADDLKTLQKELYLNPQSGIRLGSNCYKIRVANSSVPTGKSAGFRVVYYYLDANGVIYLMSIYSKSELENLRDEEIMKILKENGL
ncbi:MAG: type II toxin-antitoxin system RelE/ParE family toxin [Sulfurimonadaceae bacterium]|jgi:mRNA-degrading endonuclease RelE of RelBE toxin-antitoxin system